jgi:hypothetical protein
LARAAHANAAMPPKAATNSRRLMVSLDGLFCVGRL